MSVIESLSKIRSEWLSRVSHSLTSVEGVRDSFLEELNRFYDLMLEAVFNVDTTRVDTILSEWIEARTQTDLKDQKNTLPPVLNQILLITFDVAHDMLNANETIEVLGAILPIYSHAMEFTSNKETQLYVQYISNEQGKVRNTLESLEKSKSDFISVAAHELKTPLTLIEGYATMLHEIIPPEYNTAVQINLYLRGINAGTRRLREIVDDMIDVSMIDNDLLSLNFQPVWIHRILNFIQREMTEPVRDRKQKLNICAFPGSDEMTFGDSERFLQALRNVVSNAIKYTPDGGTITIDGRLLPGFVEITVTDTGIGINPDDHERIFEKFGRIGDVSLHSTSKIRYKGGGPGLGLPIAKGIIEAHGGAIWVESEGCDDVKCPGSVFHIMLPIQKTPPDDKTARLFGTLLEEKYKSALNYVEKTT